MWELIDGLQRLSTLFQLTGDLKGDRADELGPLILNGTQFLPSLNGRRWVDSADETDDGIGQVLQIEIKRARVRVEILKSESDVAAKFELFQRLNTGGAILTEQEVRNSIAVSVNRAFYDWLIVLSHEEAFVTTTNQTDAALESQAGMELVLRFLAFRSVRYRAGLDVHEYLDKALMQLATDRSFNVVQETNVFNQTFRLLSDALGEAAFKRWNGHAFAGKFLMSVFEVLATGISYHVDELTNMPSEARNDRLVKTAKDLWANPVFTTNSGAGVRGTTRLSRLLPLSQDLFNRT